MAYQYDYEFEARNGEMVKGHCMTVFRTHGAAAKALTDRMNDLKEQGYDPHGEVVEVEEDKL